MVDSAHARQVHQVQLEANLRLKSSPVFHRIIELSIVEPELWNVLASANDLTQGAQLYPAAIHAMLMESPGAALAAYFPTLGGSRTPAENAFSIELLGFVQQHRTEITALIRTRRYIVKCDIRRAAVLRCAVAESWRELCGPSRYALIDFGCSMGAALLLDRSTTTVMGDSLRFEVDAQQSISLPLRGSSRPDPALPRAERRVGLDVTRLDPTSEIDRNFVLGHVFPEQVGAFHALAAANRRLSLDPPTYRIGDTIAELAREFSELPSGLPVILMHSMMIHCLPAEARNALDRVLDEETARRPVARVSFEIAGPASTLKIALNGAPPRMLGRAGYDADWLSWMA